MITFRCLIGKSFLLPFELGMWNNKLLKRYLQIIYRKRLRV